MSQIGQQTSKECKKAFRRLNAEPATVVRPPIMGGIPMPPVFKCEEGKELRKVEGSTLVCCVDKEKDNDQLKKTLIWVGVGVAAIWITVLTVKAFKNN